MIPAVPPSLPPPQPEGRWRIAVLASVAVVAGSVTLYFCQPEAEPPKPTCHTYAVAKATQSSRTDEAIIRMYEGYCRGNEGLLLESRHEPVQPDKLYP